MFIQYSLKRAETRKLKRFLKKSTKIRNGWTDGDTGLTLTKYTNKESTFHNFGTFHTTIPTQVAVTH